MFRRSNHAPSLAILVSRRHAAAGDATADASLLELEQLLHGLGITALRRVIQRRRSPGLSFLGSGKQDELAALTAELKGLHGEGNLLIAVDDQLRPGQMRRLEDALELPVIDRTGVILRVFEQRAKTAVARLEIEIARLAYEAPRLRHEESVIDSEGGGGGRGGRGHTSVELEKQRIRRRLAAMRRELAEITSREEKQRARRDALRVALVGYTNSGKSSLMRALTGADVLVEDALFATLGSTVRAMVPAASPPVLVSDTVGFIRNLPHQLVASFRSTLAEARDAGLLLHVVDASDPAWQEQMRVTRGSLIAVGAAEIPELVVLNKVDRLDAQARTELARAMPDAILVSALDPDDAAALRQAIAAFFDGQLEHELLLVPHGEGQLLGEIRSRARVVAEVYGEAGVQLEVRALPADLERWCHLRADPQQPLESMA